MIKSVSVYLFLACLCLGLRLEKLAVRMAYEAQDRLPTIGSWSFLHGQQYGIISFIALDWQTAYPACSHCHWPVLPKQPHVPCEDELKAAICLEEGCRERAAHEGYCDADWQYNFACHDCNGDIRICQSNCINPEPEPDDSQSGNCTFCGYDCNGNCDDEQDEDPLAGDVEPTGGYYEEPIHPFEAHRLSVMRQHGDYTG